MLVINSFLKSFIPSKLDSQLGEQLVLARHVFFVAAPLGIIVGAAIAAYDYVITVWLWQNFQIHFSPFVLCFLPILGMLFTGMILSFFKVKNSSMADEVVRAYHKPEEGIDYKTAIPKMGASMATIGFGASAGMEGASKWVGATITSFLQKRINRIKKLKIFHGSVEVSLLAGAAAGIGAIFRAPLTGAIMGIESPYKEDLAHEALLHGLVASATSYATYIFFRPSTPYFPITFKYVLHYRDLFYSILLGVLAGMASHLFLATTYFIKKHWSSWQSPVLFKYFSGGVLLCLIALLSLFAIGEPATLQSGLPIANKLLNGQYVLFACIFLFVFKLLATALTFGTGGVAGLFIPSATIGAALGAICDIVFQPSQPGIFTLIGIAAFTGASYNSILFSAVFIAEATGSPALIVPGLLASCTAFLVASGISNSPSQIKQHFRKELRKELIVAQGDQLP